jgi:signal transduction histidine kinase
MRPVLDQDGVQFRSEVEPPTLVLDADQEMIEQVLINLVKNAAEAVKERTDGSQADGGWKPTIVVRAYLDGRGHVNLEVSDNGPGIPPDVLERIFVPFFTTKKSGSGIGLSLSRDVMRQHGGTIALSSDSEGTTARLRF